MNMAHPSKPADGPLAHYWDCKVKELVQVKTTPALSEEEKERHRLYCYLVMAIVGYYWNGNIHGHGKYQWRDKQLTKEYETYIGHNIACIAVDEKGKVLDFDFNHNQVHNSSIEHAEARLVRRLFSLAHVYGKEMLDLPRIQTTVDDAWWKRLLSGGVNAAEKALEDIYDKSRATQTHYSSALRPITLYTSLESCAQCSGIMALGYVNEVVFLQMDPDQYSIGNILYNLNKESEQRAPRPIPAGEAGIGEFRELNRKFASFRKGVKAKPFFPDDDSGSIISFLCTDSAMDVFQGGGKKLFSVKCQYPTWQPRKKGFNTLSNEKVLHEVQNFYRYAVTLGRRGSPH